MIALTSYSESKEPILIKVSVEIAPGLPIGKSGIFSPNIPEPVAFPANNYHL
ncbi:hypothetical protein [Staphylococcus haemolyticus]|uniref:hypothetical protein n=1 Tax=Staphylococcus haemolyticus TaxID=1283 RepID=UPI002ACEA033|nr:hypothetical protein [Staphylococcus haemolyticus]